MLQDPDSVLSRRLYASRKSRVSGETGRRVAGRSTHVGNGVESPHERLIPRVFDHTWPTEMVNDIGKIFDPVLRFPRPEPGVEIRFRKCRNNGWYMRNGRDIKDDDNLGDMQVSCSKGEGSSNFRAHGWIIAWRNALLGSDGPFDLLPVGVRCCESDCVSARDQTSQLSLEAQFTRFLGVKLSPCLRAHDDVSQRRLLMKSDWLGVFGQVHPRELLH